MSPVDVLAPLDWHRLTTLKFDPVSVLLVAVGVLYAVGVQRFGAIHPGQGWSVRRTVGIHGWPWWWPWCPSTPSSASTTLSSSTST